MLIGKGKGDTQERGRNRGASILSLLGKACSKVTSDCAVEAIELKIGDEQRYPRKEWSSAQFFFVCVKR